MFSLRIATGRFGFLLFSLIGLLAPAAGTARADDSYYMIMFAQQSEGISPRLAHTFATFVKASRPGRLTETHTISWLPKSRDVHLVRLLPEPGLNLELEETLRWGKSLRMQSFMWGPYQIKKELYERAVRQEARLKEGKLQYKAVDLRHRPDTAINCIHAVSDLDADKGLMPTSVSWGEAASYEVLLHLKHWIIEPDKTHDWAAEKLISRKDAVQHRKWEAESPQKDDRGRPGVKLVIRFSL